MLAMQIEQTMIKQAFTGDRVEDNLRDSNPIEARETLYQVKNKP